MSSDLPFASATSLAEALRARRVSSRELLNIYLRRIERYNPKINGEQRRIFEGLAWAGFSGVCLLPATVAPVGRTPEGLPVGVQIVAPYLEDRTAIDIARRMAGVLGGFGPPPGYDERAQVTEGAQQ